MGTISFHGAFHIKAGYHTVYKRLSNKHLGDFSLEHHTVNTSRSEVFMELYGSPQYDTGGLTPQNVKRHLKYLVF